MFSLKWGRKYGKKYHRFKSLAQWRQNVSSFAYQLCDLENNLVKYPFFNMQKQTLQYLLVFLLSICLCVCVCIFPSRSWYRLNYNSVSPHKMLSSFSSNFQFCWWEKKIKKSITFLNSLMTPPTDLEGYCFLFLYFSYFRVPPRWELSKFLSILIAIIYYTTFTGFLIHFWAYSITNTFKV